uniref:Uncharacterized protein n=1 Tax=uncultured prokaryote TaxID=198431 RepID=A0A0H5Q5X9_9ZZZZ|nr:hypothetical protein [uncultured prokaryote]
MIRLRVLTTGVAGTPGYSNFYFGGDTTADATDARTRVLAFYTAIKGHFGNTVSWQVDTDVPVIDTVTGNILEVLTVAAGSAQGSGSGTLIPLVAQIMVRLKTGVFDGGRQIQGRLNLSYAVDDVLTTSGAVGTIVRTPLDAAANTLIGTGANRWGIYSRKAEAFVPISTASTWSSFASLRSRRD